MYTNVNVFQIQDFDIDSNEITEEKFSVELYFNI